MRAPEFWRQDGWTARALAPFGALWGFAARVRFALTRPWSAPVPVVCIGNLVAGGAGKTPVALSLGARLKNLGIAVHFLTRGYGGLAHGPLRVDPSRHGFRDVGDEALLLADLAPTWVAVDRVAGACAAVAAGAQAIVMDDGLQNPSLAKDLSLVVIDGSFGFGNGRVLPAGPLREPVARGVARADAVAIVGDDTAGVAPRLAALGFVKFPILRARVIAGPEATAFAGRKVIAFAGIGWPAKFFATLRAVGAQVVATHAFPDHHPFTAAEFRRLKTEAERSQALLVTTAKDAVRVPESERASIWVLTIALSWDDEAALDALLKPVLTAASC